MARRPGASPGRSPKSHRRPSAAYPGAIAARLEGSAPASGSGRPGPLSAAAVERLVSEAMTHLDPRRRPDLALVIVERILESDPRNAAAIVVAALCAQRMGDADAAAAMFDSAIEIVPQQAMPHRLKAALLLELGRLEAAIAELRQAEALDPNDAATQNALGAAYGQAGEAERSAAAYRAASALDPRIFGLRRGPMLLDMAAGRLEEAEARYRALLAADGRNPEERFIFAGRVGSVADWCRTDGAPYRVVAPASPDVIFPPRYFGEPIPGPVPVMRPETYVAEIPDATIIGGETLVRASSGEILLDVAGRPGADRFDLAERVMRFVESGVAIVDAAAPMDEPIEAAIALHGVSSANYYHWLVEFLARIAVLEASPSRADYAELPFLVDRPVLAIPQLVAALEFVVGSDRRLIPLDKGVARRVRRLVVPSQLAWMPNNLADGEDLRLEDYYVSSEAIRFLRRRLNTGGLDLDSPGTRRIYLAKSGGRLRLLNGAELVSVLGDFDIETVNPEALSLADQIRLFASAKLVVSETGAALTNLLFCPPGCHAVITMGARWDVAWFSQIAGVVGQDATFVAGRVVRPNAKVYQSSYAVDPAVLRSAVAAALAASPAAAPAAAPASRTAAARTAGAVS